MRYVALLVALFALTGCTVVFIPIPLTMPDPDKVIASIPSITPTATTATSDDVLAQIDAIRGACDPSMTMAQQKKALAKISPFFVGKEVQLTGTINNVRDLGGTYDAIVTLDGTGRDVRMDGLSEAQALSFNIGDSVLLTGKIEVTGCTAYVQVYGKITKQ